MEAVGIRSCVETEAVKHHLVGGLEHGNNHPN